MHRTGVRQPSAAPGSWRSLPATPTAGSSRTWSPRATVAARGAVAFLVGLGLALLGMRGAAGAAVLAAAVLAVVAVIGGSLARRADRLADSIGHGAGLVVGIVGAVVLDVFVSVPARALGRIRGRATLRSADLAGAGSTWRRRTSSPLAADRPWQPEIPGSRRHRRRLLPRPLRLAAIAATLVAVDLLAGSLVEQAGPLAWVQPAQEVRPGVEAGVPGVGTLAERSAAPALAEAPWGESCLREVRALSYVYEPFWLRHPKDTDGSCVSVEDGVRRTWEPVGSGLPLVWLYGGSAAFGEGQRDGHTIASALARQAAAAGRPVRVVNLAQPGLTAYQEALLLERRLAVESPPDLVIFLDGANDIVAQSLAPSGRPTVMASTLARSHGPAGHRSLLSRWRDASLAVRLVTDGPAAAGPAEDGVAEQADRVSTVYQRSIRLAGRAARQRGAAFVAVFQPARFYEADPVAAAVVATLPSAVVDLTDALDGQRGDVWIDSVHVNEAGAQAIATALRSALAGTVLNPDGG